MEESWSAARWRNGLMIYGSGGKDGALVEMRVGDERVITTEDTESTEEESRHERKFSSVSGIC